MKKNIIEVEKVSKKYGNFLAVDDISFTGEEGEIIAFLGPNGAGKTTTMRILTCFMPATEGTARIDGFDIFDDSLSVRERIGYLPETPPLYPDMTVQSYLKFVAELKDVERSTINAKVEKVIDECGLDEMRTRLISKLSKGYRQRVGIAQAIIHEPKVIILDEPTVGLDPNQVVEIRELIKNLSKDRTVLLSTHILSEAEMLCSKVVIIDKGKIVAQGSWSDLKQDLQDLHVIKIKLDEPTKEKISAIKSISGVEEAKIAENGYIKVFCAKDSKVKNDIIKLTAEKNWDLEEIKSDYLSLEEVFKKLTQKEGNRK